MEWTPVDLAMARQHQQRMATAIHIRKAMRAVEPDGAMTAPRHTSIRCAARWVIAHGQQMTLHLRGRLHRHPSGTTSVAID
jgi:hypothetical protein